MQLTIAAKAPIVAYPALVAAAFVNSVSAGITVEYVDEKSVKEKGPLEFENLFTTKEVLQKLSENFPKVLPSKGSDEWIDFAERELVVKDFKKVSAALDKLESHLNFRSFVVGYSVSVADIAVWGFLRGNSVVGAAIKSGTYINISRWYHFLEHDSRLGKTIETMVSSLNETRKKASSGKKNHKANFDIGLQDAKDGQVVTRFPPEPSGYLHIGHAKAAVLNKYFADMYHGKLIIRFDDTNPSKEKVEFQDSILEDLQLLGIKGDRITYSSDYFQQMFDLQVQMIKDGNAYCDDTVQEEMRAERMEGIASKRRDRSVEENLEVFTKEMFNGTEIGLQNCVRAKIDYKALNKTLRDPVLYRCNLTPHHRTGSAWKVYPTYDFCVPVVDSLEGVTHALRTIEYRDRNAQYDWIIKALKLRPVHIWDFARVNFVRTLLSKRKLQWFVDKNYVGNWDDPRFPTVRGVRRRGMTVEGLTNFIVSQGPSKNIINLDWNLIWATNKKIIDPIAPRYTAMLAENIVPVTVVGGPEAAVVEEKPKHKKNAELGMKKMIFSSNLLLDQADAATLTEGEEITFMDWGNVIVTKVEKSGDIVTSLEVKLHLEGDFKKTSKKINWLADTPEKVNVDLVDFDHLITKDKLEEGDDFEDFLTKQTEFHTAGVADLNISSLEVGDIIQFERKGYYRLDVKGDSTKPYVFFTIPDGKSVNKYGAK